MKHTLLLLLLAVIVQPVRAATIVTEVAPWSSGNSPLSADWFELTNTGPGTLNISGWRMDDNSNSFGSSVALRGVTSIAQGQSVIFFEGAADGSTDATITSQFNVVWGTSFVFGSTIGAYGGAGVGLSTAGDAVNIYTSSGVLQAQVVFGASPGATPFATFNNAALLNNATITTLSVAGTNGAFARLDAFGNTEIGSPGTIGATSAVPEPSTGAAVCIGSGALILFTRRRTSHSARA